MCTLLDGMLVSKAHYFLSLPTQQYRRRHSCRQPLPHVRIRKRYAEQRRERDVDPRGSGLAVAGWKSIEDDVDRYCPDRELILKLYEEADRLMHR
jgi:hypothetical protein